MRNLLRIATALVVCVPLMLVAPKATAGAYPDHPVKLIVPFAAGGSADSMARLIAPKLGEILGQSIVVENRSGANGNIATENVARAPHDGYTLLLAFDATLVINPHVYPGLGFDPVKDFAPVIQLAKVPMMLVANPTFPASTVSELIDYAKEHPGLTYSSAGFASTPHLAMLLFQQSTGTRFEHVAYKGGGQAVIDVLGGHVPLLSTGFPVAINYLKDGRLKAIGIMTAKRHTLLPDLGTFEEAGVANFDLSFWLGVVAPAGTTTAVVERLNEALNQVLQDPEIRARVGSVIGGTPVGGSPDDFARAIRSDLKRWGDVVRSSGIKIDR